MADPRRESQHAQQQSARMPAAPGIAVAVVSVAVAVVVLVAAVAWAAHRTDATAVPDLVGQVPASPAVTTVTRIVAGISDGRIVSSTGASMPVVAGFTENSVTVPGIDAERAVTRFEKKLSSSTVVFDVVAFGPVTGDAAKPYTGPASVRTTAAEVAAVALSGLAPGQVTPYDIKHRTLRVAAHAGHEVCFKIKAQTPYAGDSYDQYCAAVLAVDNTHALASVLAVVSSKAPATLTAWRAAVSGVRFA